MPRSLFPPLVPSPTGLQVPLDVHSLVEGPDHVRGRAIPPRTGNTRPARCRRGRGRGFPAPSGQRAAVDWTGGRSSVPAPPSAPRFGRPGRDGLTAPLVGRGNNFPQNGLKQSCSHSAAEDRLPGLRAGTKSCKPTKINSAANEFMDVLGSNGWTIVLTAANTPVGVEARGTKFGMSSEINRAHSCVAALCQI
jgi:hypothetical protein